MEFEKTGGEFWNMATAYMKRIDELSADADEFMFKKEFDNAFMCVDAMYRRIKCKMNTKQTEEFDKKRNDGFSDMKQWVVEESYTNKNKLNQKLYITLTWMINYLFQVLDEKNLLTPKRSDPNFAILSR